MSLLRVLLVLVRHVVADRAELTAENLALRQQLAALKHQSKRPRLQKRDRIFWVWLSRLWTYWRSALLIVQPETVVCWHQQGFKLYWRWKSRTGNVGRCDPVATPIELPAWGIITLRYEHEAAARRHSGILPSPGCWPAAE